MLVTSFKDAEEIRSTSLLALPAALNWSAWGTAWQSACTGVDCNGLRPFFWNSVAMAVPAVLISTVWGALNGYVLSLWKFRGSDTLFGLLLFGVFMPFQVVLLPMSQVLGWLGLSSSITGLVLVHCLAGLAGTTLFFRNYYSKPITVGLNNLANTSSSVKAYNVDMAAAIIAGLPTMVIYVLAGKFFVRGLTAGAGAALNLTAPASANEVLLGVRPEHLVIQETAPWRGRVSVVEPTGPDTYVMVDTAAGSVTLRTDAQTRVQPGDTVGLAVEPANAHWFDASSENRLA
eukprot:gene16608-16789_t